MSFFPEPYTRSVNKIKAELDLSNYATKYDLKNVAGVNTSKFSKKAHLASLKSEVVKLDLILAELDVDKLERVSIDVKTLSDVVYNDVLKKTVYDELVRKC